MKKVTLRWAMILGALVIVFLAIGKIFDSRCEGGCLSVAVHDSLKRGGNSINLDIGDLSFNDDSVKGDLGGTIGSDGDLIAELPPMDDVDAIEIQSVSTEWQVTPTEGKIELRFQELQKNNWTISKKGKKVTIDIKPSGAERAELDLPKAWKGTLRLKTISGDVTIGEVLGLAALQLDTASGDVRLSTWPSSVLEVNTVSGDIHASASNAIPQPKDITLHSVSGDFNFELKSPFQEIHSKTVSGSLNLRLPKSSAFNYELRTISGEFDGMPSGGNLKEGFGTKEMRGKVGEGVSGSNLHFESVSGDFSLDQGDGLGSR